MTSEDKLSLRGQLLAEIEQAEENLAYRREKAFQLIDGLREVADRIELNARLEPSSEDFSMEANVGCGLPAPSRPMLDFDSAVALLVDLKKHRQSLYNLRLRNLQMTRRSAINTI